MKDEPLCNICGKSADWRCIFSFRENNYAVNRCHKHMNSQEELLNNARPWNNIPLWYGSWALPSVVGNLNHPDRIPVSEILIREARKGKVIPLPNKHEDSDYKKRKE